jgi:oligopeptidase B
VSAPAPHPPQRRDGSRRIGTATVPDPYAWMREPGGRSDLLAWLFEERRFHDRIASRYEPWHARLAARARDLTPESGETPTWTAGGARWLWRQPFGMQHQQLVRRGTDSDEVVLDVNALSDTGFVRVGDCAVDPTGHLVAYTLDTVGDEAYQLRVRDIASGAERLLADRVYYGLAWSADGTRLLSVVHDAADRPFQVCVHEPNGDAAPSVLFTEDDQRFHVGLRVSGDGRYAVIRSASRPTSQEWLVDLHEDGALIAVSAGPRPDGVDYFVEPLSVAGRPMLAVAIEDERGLHRVLLQDADAPLGAGAELLPPAPVRRPSAMTAVGGSLLVTGRNAGCPALWVLDVVGDETPRLLTADMASTLELTPFDAGDEGSVCVANERLTEPVHWSRLSLASGELTDLPTATSVKDSAALRTEQLDVSARDGVMIPVTIIRRADVPLDGRVPCLLYGYGAWETVIEPRFDAVTTALIEAGVVYAHAHVRGGGELGRDWWRAGRMEHKHRTFDDFEDVARHLADGVVDPARIVARGLSAGGLLMGAIYAQAPELFAGILAEAPFVDPVTTMSDPSAPLVIVEREEWGDPRRESDRSWMLSWSPYDNPPPRGMRPRLLVTSAVHDPRVAVWEPARWVARLRETGSDDDSVLLCVDQTPRGHWPPPGRDTRIDFQAALGAWIADTMGL